MASIARWLRLVLALALLAGTVAALHRFSAELGGSTGAMIRSNQAADREVYAYVYSEVTALEEVLDHEAGRSGATPVGKAQRAAQGFPGAAE